MTAAICWGLGVAGRNAEPGTFLYQFPEMRLNKAVVMSVLKLSFIFVGMITFNNLCEPLAGPRAGSCAPGARRRRVLLLPLRPVPRPGRACPPPPSPLGVPGAQASSTWRCRTTTSPGR